MGDPESGPEIVLDKKSGGVRMGRLSHSKKVAGNLTKEKNGGDR